MIGSIGSLFSGADALTRAYLVKAFALTLCIGFMATLLTVLAVMVQGRDIPPFLAALLSFFVGGSFVASGSHVGAANAAHGAEAVTHALATTPAVAIGEPASTGTDRP